MVRCVNKSNVKSFVRVELVLAFLVLIFHSVAAFNPSILTVDFLNVVVLPNLMLSVLAILYCCADIKQRFLLFIFSLAYAIQINGKYFAHVFDDEPWGSFCFSVFSAISYDNELRGLLYIFLAQFAVLVAYQSKFGMRIPSKLDFGNGNIKGSIRIWSKRVMWFAFVFAFIKSFLKISYVFQYGYFASYLATGSAIFNDPVIDIFERFYWLGFIGFLSTFPSKREFKFPVIVFLIFVVTTILDGTRGGAVIYTLFVIWYLMKRDLLGVDVGQIITPAKMRFLAVVGICSLYGLYIYGFIRVGAEVSFDDFFGKIFMLVESHGVSGRLPALCLEYKSEINNYLSSAMMLCGPVYAFLVNNSVVRIFTGGALGQGVGTLGTFGFGGVITYITNTSAYLNGGGLGTSFIAECGTAYGAVGVVVFSVILGILMREIDNIELAWGWPKTVLALNAVPILGYIPRQSSLGIIPASAAVVLFIILMHLAFARRRNYVR